MDISEQCGYTIAQQAALFHSIKPLFSNKPLMVVANKTDVTPLSSLPESDTALLAEMVQAAAVASNGGILHCLCLKPLAYAELPAMHSGTGLQLCLDRMLCQQCWLYSYSIFGGRSAQALHDLFSKLVRLDNSFVRLPSTVHCTHARAVQLTRCVASVMLMRLMCTLLSDATCTV